MGDADHPGSADGALVHATRILVRKALGRELGVLALIWGLGALMLVSALTFSEHADQARQRQVVVAQMRESFVSAPWIAFSSSGSNLGAVGLELAGLSRSLNGSAAHLEALGDHRYAPQIAGAIGPAIELAQQVAVFAAAGQDSAAVGVINRAALPGGTGAVLYTLLDDADTSYLSDSRTAERRGDIAAVLLALFVLVAFSVALDRSLRARRRAEALSSDKQELLELSRSEATTDALTGMPNRRALFEDAERLLRSLPEGASLSLGIFDLDGFKAYNDSFGHPAGDALLAHLGRQLTAAVAGRGTGYRMGGDEFCVVTVDGDAGLVHRAAASALSERGERFAIGCSYGFAAIPGESSSLEQALQAADRRLYGHKEHSRSSQRGQIKDALVQVLAEQSGDLVTHLGRVAMLSVATAERLVLPIAEVERIRLAAELHDVGKSAVPRAILDKTGPLCATELAFLRQHSVIGERIVAAAPALANVAPLVRASHERPDGSGYPDGLRLDQIPIGSRVIAVVDAFDAMTTNRPYQKTRSVEQAVAELRRGAGTQFDGAIVDVFAKLVLERDELQWRRLRAEPAEDDERPQPSERAGSDRRANRG